MSSAIIEIFHLIIQTTASVLVGACILRAYMIYIQLNMSASSGNPIGRFVLSATNWIVLPLRKAIPIVGRFDFSSVLAAYLFCLSELILFSLLVRFSVPSPLLLLSAVWTLMNITISLLTVLLIVHAVSSWVQANSLQAQFLNRLLSPLLRPFQKIIPLVGGIDFSPLFLLLSLQILKIIIGAFIAEAHLF